jgi:hypothetical protein
LKTRNTLNLIYREMTYGPLLKVAPLSKLTFNLFTTSDMESLKQDGVRSSAYRPRRDPGFIRYLEKAIKLKQLPCRNEQPITGPPAYG